MIEYFKANYPAMGGRFFLACRWTAWLAYCWAFYAGWAFESHPFQAYMALMVSSGLVLLAQWIIIGRVKLEVFLPWTKLGGSEIEAKEG